MQEEHFISEALRIVKEAEREGTKLRIMGALAVKLHCPDFSKLHTALDRKFTDIDFAGLSSQQKKIRELLNRLGYKERVRGISRAYGTKGRLIHEHETTQLIVDVFLDKLDMCHCFRFNIDGDYPTIPLADIVLEKLQIVKITEKDVKDLLVLLQEHKLGSNDREKVDINYIANLLKDDWGFYYTVVLNLKKLQRIVESDMFKDIIEQEHKDEITPRIQEMLKVVEETPKSGKWKMRAKIGPKVRWYKEVHTVCH